MVETEWFYLRNWSRFQHYKERRPVWVKLHVEMLDNYEFQKLPDDNKLLAICLIILSARSNKFTKNNIPLLPSDPRWIMQQACLEKIPDLKPLYDSAFIIRYQENEIVLAGNSSCASLETEKEKEYIAGDLISPAEEFPKPKKRGRPKKTTDPDHAELVKYFHNRHMELHGVKPKITGKEAALLKTLLSTLDLNILMDAVDDFMKLDDTEFWVAKAGHSIVAFYNVAHRLAEKIQKEVT